MFPCCQRFWEQVSISTGLVWSSFSSEKWGALSQHTIHHSIRGCWLIWNCTRDSEYWRSVKSYSFQGVFGEPGPKGEQVSCVSWLVVLDICRFSRAWLAGLRAWWTMVTQSFSRCTVERVNALMRFAVQSDCVHMLELAAVSCAVLCSSFEECGPDSLACLVLFRWHGLSKPQNSILSIV